MSAVVHQRCAALFSTSDEMSNDNTSHLLRNEETGCGLRTFRLRFRPLSGVLPKLLRRLVRLFRSRSLRRNYRRGGSARGVGSWDDPVHRRFGYLGLR